jgi:hypothetical protein
LPISRDELYPLSAASIPIQLDLRKCFTVGAAWRFAATAGPIWHLDSGREYLDPSAFPNGAHLTGEVHWQLGARRTLELGYTAASFDRRTSHRIRLRYWLPSGASDAFSLALEQELTGMQQRPFATYVGILWRFTQRPPREE